MRYATVVVSPTADTKEVDEYADEHYDGQGPPDNSEIWLKGTHVATQKRIHYANLLDDGSVILVAQFRGDPALVERLTAAVPEIHACRVSSGETFLAWVQYEPNPTERSLFEIIDTEAITIDWPIAVTSDGLRVTVLGDEETLQTLFDGIPAGVEFRLERSGEYRPGLDAPTSQLTDRQLEILQTALDRGYYEIPRQATQREIADALEVSRGTVGEHLRRAEATVVRSVLSDGGPA